MKETRLAKPNTNIFYRLIKSFLSLFKTSKKEEKKAIERHKNIDEFKDNIKVKEDKGKIRLLNLQSDFEKGIIKESEMDEQDVYALHQLYNSQIEELEISTENYKKRIINAKRKLKNE